MRIPGLPGISGEPIRIKPSEVIQHCAADDLVLHILAQFHKKGGITGNADDEVPVVTGALLRLKQDLEIGRAHV